MSKGLPFALLEQHGTGRRELHRQRNRDQQRRNRENSARGERAIEEGLAGERIGGEGRCDEVD
jgi:hypothetical protein